MRFGISSLMIVVLVASVVCGIALHGSFVAFGIGFMALAILISRLMAQSTPSLATVTEAANEMEAELLCGVLIDRGVPARVESGLVHQIYAGVFRPRVIVPAEFAERARSIMEELEHESGPDAPGPETERIP